MNRVERTYWERLLMKQECECKKEVFAPGQELKSCKEVHLAIGLGYDVQEKRDSWDEWSSLGCNDVYISMDNRQWRIAPLETKWRPLTREEAEGKYKYWLARHKIAPMFTCLVSQLNDFEHALESGEMTGDGGKTWQTVGVLEGKK